MVAVAPPPPPPPLLLLIRDEAADPMFGRVFLRFLDLCRAGVAAIAAIALGGNGSHEIAPAIAVARKQVCHAC